MQPFAYVRASDLSSAVRAFSPGAPCLAGGTNMRGPGETTGIYALEVTMDELAHHLSLDPLELRRRNEPDTEPMTGKIFSCCRRLLDCIDRGAAAFHWEKRRQVPGTWGEGSLLIGYGDASTTLSVDGQSLPGTLPHPS